MARKILIVEDNRALGTALAAAASQAGARTELVATASQARKLLEADPTPFCAMILDIGLPDQNGLSFLESLPEHHRPPTIIITAHGELNNTIQAKKLGVLEFFPKPLDFAAFKTALENLPGSEQDTGPPAAEIPSAFIGAAPAMRPVFQQVAHACACDAPVLVTGETGTGKSLTASLIQRNGMEAGARTGIHHPPATRQAEALAPALEDSRGGSLILENIDSLGSQAQATLLQHWEGGRPDFPRILAVSSSDLRASVEEGTFRSDLYYRLQVLEIRLPPLRDRMEDLVSLFTYFLAQLQPGQGLQADRESARILAKYHWPGNLRELRNVASFAVTACSPGTTILPAHLPEYLADRPKSAPHGEDALDEALDQWLAREDGLPPYRELSGELERRLLERLLPKFDGKLARLASQLGANRSTLRKRLRR